MNRYLPLLFIQLLFVVSTETSVQAIIFAAGKSTRFKSDLPKLLTPIHGKPIVMYAIDAALTLEMPITLVIGYKKKLMQETIDQAYPNNTITFAIQEEQKGTGHALQCTQSLWFADDILIMNGDHPLTDAHLLKQFYHEHQKNNATFSILTAEAEKQCSYGRIVQENGHTRIVEAVDFAENPEDYPLVNAGFYLIKRSFLEKHIDKLWLHTNKNEYYITDLIEIADNHNVQVQLVQVPFNYVYGVNTQEEFLHAEALLSKRQDSLITQ